MISKQAMTARAACVLALTGAAGLAACGDLFEVQNPGRILDEDLNTPKAMPTLVAGMSADFSAALDNMIYVTARLSDEMARSGNYVHTALFRVGIVEREYVDGVWNSTQRARWVAESGLERMREVLGPDFEGNPLTARAYLFAGLSNRLLGENFCEVIYDGGAPQPPSAAYERAREQFTTAIDHARRAGDREVELAAIGGRAQVLLALGRWNAAVADAQAVPTDFVYNAIYSSNTSRETNTVWSITHPTPEMGAYQTLAGSFVPPDPRAPYTDCRLGGCPRVVGQDGKTPHFRQEKYADPGADIPVVKGTEMRLIEAEARLLAEDVPGAVQKMNEARAVWGLDPLGAATAEEGWKFLDDERHLTLWLEARRLFDLHRWDHPFLRGGTIVYPGVENRASCLILPLSECQTNPNASCS